MSAETSTIRLAIKLMRQDRYLAAKAPWVDTEETTRAIPDDAYAWREIEQAWDARPLLERKKYLHEEEKRCKELIIKHNISGYVFLQNPL